MGTEYEHTPKDINQLAAEVMEEYHADLEREKITVTCWFADGGFDDVGQPKPALKEHGIPCAATVRATKSLDRVMGLADAVILIDKRIWNECLTDASKRALLDHELEHLELDRDKDGVLKVDCAKRPVLKMRKHDWELGVFESIIQRHGIDAVDSQNVWNFLQSTGGQMCFDFVKKGIQLQLPGQDAPPPTPEPNSVAELVPKAVEIIKTTHRATTSSLQRRLRIGYPKANQVMDALEEQGIIGPPNGSEPREILIDLDKGQAAA